MVTVRLKKKKFGSRKIRLEGRQEDRRFSSAFLPALLYLLTISVIFVLLIASHPGCRSSLLRVLTHGYVCLGRQPHCASEEATC